MFHYKTFLSLLSSVCTALVLTQCSDEVPLPEGSVKMVDVKALTLMKEARIAQEKNQINKAINRYQKVAEKHSLSVNAPEARFQLGQLYEYKNEPVDAFDQYQRLIDSHPDSSLYTLALDRQKQLAFSAAEGKMKNKVLWTFDVSVDPSIVIKWLKGVRENAPYSDTAPQALFVLGNYCLKRNLMNDAVEAFQTIVDHYKQSKLMPLAQLQVAEIYRGLAAGGDKALLNVNLAREAYEDFLQLYPNSENANVAQNHLADIRKQLVSQRLKVADYYEHKMRDRNAAVFCYNEVIRMGKDNPAAAAKARQALQKMGVKPDLAQ